MASPRAGIDATELAALNTHLTPSRERREPVEASEAQESALARTDETPASESRSQDYLIPFSCRLPISIHQKLDELKRERGLDKTEVVKAALLAYLKKVGK